MSTERILIVEDERIIALDLKRRLEKFGYSVTDIVSTGQDAIDTAQLQLPDIIIMDIMLSGDMDGISAAGYIKDHFEIPIIFLTAFSDNNTLERAKFVEPYGYILKPFKEKELHTTIDIAIYKYRMEKKLKTNKQWLSSILASIGDGIIATNSEGKIDLINLAAQRILCIDEQTANGKGWKDILHFGDPSIDLDDIFTTMNDHDHISLDNQQLFRAGQDPVYINGIITKIISPDKRVDGQVLVLKDISEVKRLSAQVNYQANHDILTGLINRESFSKKLHELISQTSGTDVRHALLYIDLDQFKVVNDVAGHVAGDQLLREVTTIIKSMIRESDYCARLGGDEFGLILRNIDDEKAEFIAHRLQAKLAGHKISFDKNSFTVKCSIGLVMISPGAVDVQSLLAAADDACYVAKEEGGNRIRMYDSQGGLFKQRRGEMEWVSKLTSAIEENRFELYYQEIRPLVDDPGAHFKAEILIRMRSDTGDLIMPADFIPAAERYQLMSNIDRWVIQRSFDYLHRLSEGSSPRKVMFSINLCAASIADERTLSFIIDSMNTYHIKPSDICFEITETAAIANMALAVSFIKEMKALGCTFSLDDFGSGFSSLNYLKNLPVDYLKIDGSFIRDMTQSKVNSAMVEAINTLAHVIGIQTVAEFAGSQEIINMLKIMQVDYAQGYHIGKPAPLKTFPVQSPA
ncbi:MAG: EAL domain-containing protein [Spirochaetales bacterium]|nr:EAL domain-containing protein [Spirochaetales bacterium]